MVQQISPKKGRYQETDKDFKKSGWCGNRRKCVEVAIMKKGVAVRNSNTPTVLYFTHAEWTVFTKGVRSGQF
ncbi:MAG: DUF397 domain-containing protein [Patescibacteria group bacterium]